MTLSLSSQIQALLFVSGEPVTKAKLSKILGVSKSEVEKNIELLAERLKNDPESGVMLIENEGSVELATKKEHAALLEEMTKSTLQENLSQAALEVLAIIAYRSPIPRSHIEAIRGVNCSFTLRNLLLRGLIERRDNPEDAREYVYAPSFAFLEKVGLSSIKELPDFGELSRDSRVSMVLEEKAIEENSVNQN